MQEYMEVRPSPVERTTCKRKKVFTDRDDAICNARIMMNNGVGQLYVYRCSFGDHWHFGHQISEMAKVRLQRLGIDPDAIERIPVSLPA